MCTVTRESHSFTSHPVLVSYGTFHQSPSAKYRHIVSCKTNDNGRTTDTAQTMDRGTMENQINDQKHKISVTCLGGGIKILQLSS